MPGAAKAHGDSALIARNRSAVGLVAVAHPEESQYSVVGVGVGDDG